MKVNDIKTIEQLAKPILMKAGVTKSSVFGSFARGEHTPKSDVDLLIDFPRDKGLFAFIELKNKLERRFGRKVDLVTYNSISPLLRKNILAEQIVFYEQN